MRILQKILGLFGFIVIKQKRRTVFKDCDGAKYVRFSK